MYPSAPLGTAIHFPSGLIAVPFAPLRSEMVRSTRALLRFRMRTAPSSTHAAATSEPSWLNEGPHAAPWPDTLARRSPVNGSHTFNLPSTPVVASIDPSGLKAT